MVNLVKAPTTEACTHKHVVRVWALTQTDTHTDTNTCARTVAFV